MCFSPYPEGEHWFLLRCKPKQDKEAKQQVENQKFSVYQPLVTRQYKNRNKIGERVESLFPGYLFVRFNPHENHWQPLRYTRGVLGFVHYGNNLPPIVPLFKMDEIRAFEARMTGQVVQLYQYQAGAVVRVTETAYHDQTAIFQYYDGAGCVHLLLEFMQQLVPLVLPSSQIAPL